MPRNAGSLSFESLPTFEDVCKLPCPTIHHVPAKARPALAQALSTCLRSILHENTEESWKKLFMLPKCLVSSPKRRGRHHKPCSIERLCDQWLKGKCLCAVQKSKASEFFAPFQFGVACPAGAEKVIHGLRHCIEEHWEEEDFVVLKIDMCNAFNLVSRQALLDECALHFPDLLPWASWCYGQQPLLQHPLGTVTSEVGVQQGDPLGPMFFCLVLHKLVSAIAMDEDASRLLFHAGYQDDGVVAGPKQSVLRALYIIQELGPPLGLVINPSKCEVYSQNDLSGLSSLMKQSNVPHLEILGSPIGDTIFCANFASQKCAQASQLLSQLEEVGSVDPPSCSTSATDMWCILRACIGVQVEAGSGLGRDEHHTRPADVLAANWMLGKPAAFDFAVTSPLISSTLHEASVTAGSAAYATEVRKHQANDVKCAELGWVSIPVVVETHEAQLPKSTATASLYGRLSITLVRANVRALLSRVITLDGY
eukprot:Em0010g107a